MRTPGDLAEWMTKQSGFAMAPNCKCRAFKKTMDDWGWRGCWQHRDEVVAWFVAQANAHNIQLTSDTALGLIRKGIRLAMLGGARD